MGKAKTRRQRAIIRRRIFLASCAAVLIGLIAIISLIVNAISGLTKNESSSSLSSNISSSSSDINEEPQLVTSASVISIGDIMAHSTQLTGAYNSQTKEYDFSAFFKEMTSYFDVADLSVANLEVTFGGEAAGSYRGYPSFNTPDSLADAIKNSGLNLLITSNNHSYDTGLSGLKRTLDVLEQKGIEYTGTRKTESDKRYLVKDVNGIKIGIADFTYETTNKDSEAGRKYLNGIRLAEEANGLVNSFSYMNIEGFYSDAEKIISDMKNEGAEFITFYMHWGEEYQLSANTWQKSIAQKLCNLGVNIIIGGHPHVVQPIELLHSEDSENTTVCVYSLGNAVSNQRRELISSCPTGHTEDGLIFSYNLEKYSDGSVILTAVDAVPTWVNKYSGGGGYQYTIYPLESEDYGSIKYSFTGANLNDTTQSYNRTKKIISEGLTECQKALGCEQRFGEIEE